MPDRTAVVMDGTLEGLLTVVYMYYYEELRPTDVIDGSLPSFQQTIDHDYRFVTTVPNMAEKVTGAMDRKFSHDTMGFVLGAACNTDENRFYDLFRYILLAFKTPKEVDLYDVFEYVVNVHTYARAVYKEVHLLKGFTRFRKNTQGVLYAEVSPKHDSLWLLCDHFSDRLGNERWIINDVKRGKAGVFDTRECIITAIPEGLKASFDEDGREQEFQKLWTAFYRTIGIRERYNAKLRRSLNPKRFWKHMTEHNRRFFEE